MKKVSLVAILATLGFGAQADNVPAGCPKAFQGFHLGGNVGIGLGTASQEVSAFWIQNNGTRLVNDLYKNRLGLKGFDGGLNTGYTYRTGNLGLGLEFVANWANSKGNFTDYVPNNAFPNNPFNVNAPVNAARFSNTLALNNSLQLRANFSYVIANLVAPKLIMGWDASKFKTSFVDNNQVLNAAGQPTAFAGSQSKYLNGFLIGLGVDFLATKHFILGMDATVSIFNKHNFRRTYTTPANIVALGGDRSYTHVARVKPTYGKISLVAKFIY